MPMASIMPIIDITLMVSPTKYITASVTSSDSGTRRADDERGRPVAQEQEQHREGERGADEPGLGEIAAAKCGSPRPGCR